MQQCRFCLTAEGCDLLHQLSVELLELLKSILQVENQKGQQHSVGHWCGPFQVHDIYYRCMMYTIVCTIEYIIEYTMIYIMVYTMIYMHVYVLFVYTGISGARSHDL
jgi:hypothetical protein